MWHIPGAILIAITLWLSTGCTYLTPPLQRPVIEDKLGPSLFARDEVMGTLSLTPERRVVLVNFANQRFCAEAPTEVGLDLSRLLQTDVAADAPGKGAVALGLLIGSSNSNSVLNKRSQAIQLFLANSYYTCQMYLNGAISGEQLVELQLKTLNSIAPILEIELPLLYQGNEEAAARPGASRYLPLDTSEILDDLFRGSLQSSDEEQEKSAQPGE